MADAVNDNPIVTKLSSPIKVIPMPSGKVAGNGPGLKLPIATATKTVKSIQINVV